MAIKISTSLMRFIRESQVVVVVTVEAGAFEPLSLDMQVLLVVMAVVVVVVVTFLSLLLLFVSRLENDSIRWLTFECWFVWWWFCSIECDLCGPLGEKLVLVGDMSDGELGTEADDRELCDETEMLDERCDCGGGLESSWWWFLDDESEERVEELEETVELSDEWLMVVRGETASVLAMVLPLCWLSLSCASGRCFSMLVELPPCPDEDEVMVQLPMAESAQLKMESLEVLVAAALFAWWLRPPFTSITGPPGATQPACEPTLHSSSDKREPEL